MDDPETSPAVFLGRELRRAREAAGFSSQDALAARLGYDALPRTASGTLILEAVEQWKTR
jgi:hypothetical protein